MALELRSQLFTFKNSTKCNENIVRSRFVFRIAKGLFLVYLPVLVHDSSNFISPSESLRA